MERVFQAGRSENGVCPTSFIESCLVRIVVEHTGRGNGSRTLEARVYLFELALVLGDSITQRLRDLPSQLLGNETVDQGIYLVVDILEYYQND